MRIRTMKHELIITPGTPELQLSSPQPTFFSFLSLQPRLGVYVDAYFPDEKYILVVLQDPGQ